MMQNEKKTSRFRFSAARAAVIALSGLMLGVCIYILIASVSAGNRMPMPFGFGAGVNLAVRSGTFYLEYALGRQMKNPISFKRGLIHFGVKVDF